MINLMEVMDTLKSDMRATIEKTIADGNEHGFVICNENGKVFKGPECHGDSCSIDSDTLGYCPARDRLWVIGDADEEGDWGHYGLFHTHPVGHEDAFWNRTYGSYDPLLMSASDFKAARFQHINCIGMGSDIRRPWIVKGQRVARCYDMGKLKKEFRISPNVNLVHFQDAADVRFMNFQADFVKKGKGVLTQVV